MVQHMKLFLLLVSLMLTQTFLSKAEAFESPQYLGNSPQVYNLRISPDPSVKGIPKSGDRYSLNLARETSGSEKNRSSKARKSENARKINTAQYVTGGVIGTWLGFGLGHFIQTRPATGLIFLATDVGSFLGFFFTGGPFACHHAEEDCVNYSGIFLLSYFVSRIVQTVDLWVQPKSVPGGFLVSDDSLLRSNKEKENDRIFKRSITVPVIAYYFK